jgi:hypothetical protein
LVPLVWIHVLRIAGRTILAPGAVGDAVPMNFRTMIGYGDMLTAVLAMVALVALRLRLPYAIGLVWLFVVVGLVDTVNAIIESMRYSVFNYPLGVNWVIVTSYVHTRPLEGTVDRLHARLQQTRDLGAAKGQHITQKQNGALARGQNLQHRQECERNGLMTVVASLWPGVGRSDASQKIVGARTGLDSIALARFDRVETGVGRDAVEPRPKRDLLAVRKPALPGAHQRFL